MDFSLITKNIITIIQKYNKMLVFVKGSPDPDVIASSFALKTLCSLYNTELSIISLLPVSLPQNQALIKKLDIPISFLSKLPDLSCYDAYIVLDHQIAQVEEIGKNLPCAIHIDHHEKAETLIDPELRILTDEAGSVSTILALTYKELKIEKNINKTLMQRIATALTYGINTDTDNMKIAHEHDKEAMKFLKPYVDIENLNRISNIPFSEETLTVLGKAMLNQVRYENWIICGVGFLPESFRDSIAIVADFILENEDATTVIVYAAIESETGNFHLDSSLRTKNINFDLNHFIKKITSNGGARHFKGAYQIDLNYFSKCPDKNLLWQIIQDSTLEKLKYEKDNLILTEKNILFKIKKGLNKFFGA